MSDDVGAGVGRNSDWLAVTAILICLSAAAMCLGVFGLGLRSAGLRPADPISYEVSVEPRSASPGDTVRFHSEITLQASVEPGQVRVRGPCAEHIEILRYSGELLASLPATASCPDSTHPLNFTQDGKRAYVYSFEWAIPVDLRAGRYTVRGRTLVEPELRAERTLQVKYPLSVEGR